MFGSIEIFGGWDVLSLGLGCLPQQIRSWVFTRLNATRCLFVFYCFFCWFRQRMHSHILRYQEFTQMFWKFDCNLSSEMRAFCPFGCFFSHKYVSVTTVGLDRLSHWCWCAVFTCCFLSANKSIVFGQRTPGQLAPKSLDTISLRAIVAAWMTCWVDQSLSKSIAKRFLNWSI